MGEVGGGQLHYENLNRLFRFEVPMKKSLLFFLLLCNFCVTGQDSLKNSILSRMNNETDREKIESCLDLSEIDIPVDTIHFYLNKALDLSNSIKLDSIFSIQFAVSRTHYISNQPKKALQSIKEAYRNYQYTGNPKGTLGQIYMLEGVFHEAMSQEDSAIHYYEKVKVLLAQDTSTKGRAMYNATMTNYANLYLKKGKHEKAIPIYLDVIKFETNAKEHNNLVVTYNNLAGSYRELKFYDQAIYYSNLALETLEKGDVNKVKGGILTSLGEIYLLQNKIDSAYIYLSDAEKEFESNISSVTLKNLYQSLANYHIHKKNYAKAEAYVIKAKKQLAIMPDDFVRTHLYVTQGILFKAKNNNKQAEIFLDSALQLAQKNEYLIIQKEVLEEKISLYEKTGDEKKQLATQKKLLAIKETIFNKDNINAIAVAGIKYETEKKEIENRALRAEKIKQEVLIENENKDKQLFALGMFLSLLTLGIFMFFYSKNKKQKDKIVTLQKELHHRVDNNLAIIDEFIDKSMESVADKKTLENLSELQSRVGSINEVHAMLYQNDDVTRVNIKQYLQALSGRVQEIYDKQDVKISIECKNNLSIDTHQSVHFGLLINEFLTNSFKYAFEGVDNPKIDIELVENNGTLELRMQDNGKGYAKEDVSNDSYGTRIMELLAKKLKASYSLSGDEGTSLLLKLETS